MRTVELSDEVYERAEREAAERGVPLTELVNQVVDRGIPRRPALSGGGRRVQLPLISSDHPGTLKGTKELIERIELEDDLRRSGTLG